MAWPKLRKSRETERQPVEAAPAPVVPPARAAREQRMKRLARKLDELPAKDELRMREARDLEVKQHKAGVELYALCRHLVDSLNAILHNLQLELTPEQFHADMLDGASGVIFQINASGRIVQLVLQSRETEISSEHFRMPYILRGAIRWFNQEYLERQEIQEHQFFYCVDRIGGSWRFVDSRSRKVGALDQDYLLETLEQLL